MWYKIRNLVCWINGSNIFAAILAKIGDYRVYDGPLSTKIVHCYDNKYPKGPAFCVGTFIFIRNFDISATLFDHEQHHSTQWAFFGLLFLPLYFIAAGLSWILVGRYGERNIFEMDAGLENGGYDDNMPLRPIWRHNA